MGPRTAERGEGRLGCILWALALAIAVLLAWKLIPVKVKSAELYDFMEELARFNAAREAPESLQAKILTRAAELGLPLSKEGIKITLTRDRVRIVVDYTVPVAFPGYTHQWHFHHELDRPIFIV